MFAEQTDLGSEMIVTDMTLHLLVTLINISYILINLSHLCSLET